MNINEVHSRPIYKKICFLYCDAELKESEAVDWCAAAKNVTFSMERPDNASPLLCPPVFGVWQAGEKRRRAGQVLLGRCLTTATRGAAGECRGWEVGQRLPGDECGTGGWRAAAEREKGTEEKTLRLRCYWKGEEWGGKGRRPPQKDPGYLNSHEVALWERVSSWQHSNWTCWL